MPADAPENYQLWFARWLLDWLGSRNRSASLSLVAEPSVKSGRPCSVVKRFGPNQPRLCL
jgi:hypothetical protein